MVSSASAAITADTASSTGMPAATRAPNTTSSKISVIGTEVASAWRKLSESLMALATLPSPDSLMVRPGCWACTAATACWSAATWRSVLPLPLALPGTWKRTSALRPSADTSEPLPAVSGELMWLAFLGWADSAAATCWAAWRRSWLWRKVTAPDRAWMRTDSDALS
jgi:hypothetical protein